LEEQAVQQSSRQHFVIKHLSPFGRFFVGGDDERGLFIELINKIEEVDSFFFLQGIA
jgi:hypothetical protein